MPTVEPHATALLLATFAALLALSTVLSRASQRVALPVALAFLGVGMLAGSEGLGRIAFDDYPLAFRLGTIALVLILFDGGLNTPLSVVKRSAGPAGVLATVGVVGTMLLLAAAAHLLGFAWPYALLLGAVVSSTDAAAVFSVLRGSGITLTPRVGGTLEVESGFNDPIAVILTTALTERLVVPGASLGLPLATDLVLEIAIGGLVGAVLGVGAGALMRRVRLPSSGLYPVLTLAVAMAAFGLATLIHGSGFLAVYVAGVALGHEAIPYRGSLLRVHDALAWLSQIAMFLILGLLVFPSRLFGVAGVGLALGLFLALVARPVVVALCLAPFGFRPREIGYVGWVGLRGAVPVILATVPVLSGAPGATHMFDVVFFIVVVNAIVPGTTVPWVTRRLGLGVDTPPAPRAVLEIESRAELEGELLSFYVDEALDVAGVPIADLPFPEGAAATMIVRGRTLIAPKGHTVLEVGDHVYVLAQHGDVPMVRLLFGSPETE